MSIDSKRLNRVMLIMLYMHNIFENISHFIEKESNLIDSGNINKKNETNKKSRSNLMLEETIVWTC